jgi:hypothetical protein
MFRSIRRILLSASGKKSRGRAPSRRASRQLGFEGLEGRKMLSSTTAAANPFGDCSFETPVLTANAFQYAPGGSAWQFSTSAGISSNGSVFTAANPKAPDGSQVAFLQGYGSMTQSVNLSAGDYSITFLAAQRATKPQTHFQQIEVLVDGAEVGFATPSSTSYDSYQTSTFTVASGVHTVEFAGLDPLGGDNTAFLDSVAVSPQTDTIGDGGFAAPQLAAGAFQYSPDGSPWQFSSGAGVAGNGSAFTAANPNAPSGTQVAFLQGNGSMSQSTYLDAGTYNLTFQAAQRAGKSQSSFQEIQVLVDGAQVGLATPASTSYALCQTSNFTLAAGTHTISLLGLDPQGGDNTAFVNELAISPAADTISDASFEAPGLPAKSFQYAPNGSSWQFSAFAGTSEVGSAFGVGTAPNGSQVAFLQGVSSMSQSVFLDAGAYGISFQAAQRSGKSQSSYQEIQVLVDGAQVGLVTPTSTNFGAYQTSTFTVAAGTHVIEFAALDPQGGDNTAFLDSVAVAPQAGTIGDGSFAVPALAAGAFQYLPNGSPWQFSGRAGVSANGSAFTAANPNAPAGTQVALIQGTGSISQSAYLYSGTYTISFQAAQRGGKSQSQEIQVLVDGAQVGLVTPAGTTYGTYETSTFTVSAGTHVIEFVGLDPPGGDNTAFLDGVTIAAQPDTISDGSFEVPALAAATYQDAPSGSSWQFAGSAGVSSNGSTITSANPNAPDGAQVAFLQDNGGMSQSTYLDAGTYSLSFQAAQCAASSQASYEEIQVLVDGAQVALVTPTGASYAAYQTPNFTVASGLHNIALVGLDPQGGTNTALVDTVALVPPADSVTDGDFEWPGLAPKSFQYAPNGSAWQFAGPAGVSSNGSPITAANPNAPSGVQVAFLQGAGSMSQSVSLTAGTYSIGFQAAQGGTAQTHYQEIQVLVDGSQVGLVTPAGTSYALYQTPTFTVTAGTHTIQLAGLNPLVFGTNTALIDQVAVLQADTVNDSDFAAPGLAADTYQVAPAGSPWQFSASAGVSSNGSPMTSANPNAPDGTQVAFLQDNGSMSQSLLLDSGTYSLTFQAAQRAGAAQTSFQEIQVLVDGVQVGLVTPLSTNYGSYQTSTFMVTSGFHTVTFTGLDPQGGDNTAFLDDVQIS